MRLRLRSLPALVSAVLVGFKFAVAAQTFAIEGGAAFAYGGPSVHTGDVWVSNDQGDLRYPRRNY